VARFHALFTEGSYDFHPDAMGLQRMDDAKSLFRVLLAGNPDALSRWLDVSSWRTAMFCLAAIVAGDSCYGAVIGSWRGEWQSVVTALKLPLVVLLTSAGNALLNASLAGVLGSRLGLRQTVLALLMSSAITGLLLAACAPVCGFLLGNAPPLGARHAVMGHSAVLMVLVTVIAWAGVIGHRALFRLLARIDGVVIARRVLVAWLAGNLLLGTQCAWILRPFVGSPSLPVQFLRDHPLHGNFFESVAVAVKHLLFQ